MFRIHYISNYGEVQIKCNFQLSFQGKVAVFVDTAVVYDDDFDIVGVYEDDGADYYHNENGKVKRSHKP